MTKLVCIIFLIITILTDEQVIALHTVYLLILFEQEILNPKLSKFFIHIYFGKNYWAIWMKKTSKTCRSWWTNTAIQTYLDLNLDVLFLSFSVVLPWSYLVLCGSPYLGFILSQSGHGPTLVLSLLELVLVLSWSCFSLALSRPCLVLSWSNCLCLVQSWSCIILLLSCSCCKLVLSSSYLVFSWSYIGLDLVISESCFILILFCLGLVMILPTSCLNLALLCPIWSNVALSWFCLVLSSSCIILLSF